MFAVNAMDSPRFVERTIFKIAQRATFPHSAPLWYPLTAHPIAVLTRKEPLMPDRRATRRLFSLLFVLIAAALLAPAGQPALAAGRTTDDPGRTPLTPPPPPRLFARRKFSTNDCGPTTNDE